MKKSRKHIAFSTLLALLVLAVQTAFFPLHYYFTHHNTPLHSQVQYENDQKYQPKQSDTKNSFEDESCYWCDLFAHQGYFLEKFSDFIFKCPDINFTPSLACIYALLKSDLPDARGPPAHMMI